MSRLTTFAKSLMLVGFVVAIPFMFLYSSFAWGFVCMKSWNWFIQPVFTMLPTLTYFPAVGLMTFIGGVIWRHNTVDKIKPEFRESTATDVTSIIMPWIVLFISWLVHLVI